MKLSLPIASGDPAILIYFAGIVALAGAAVALGISGVALALGKSEEKKSIAKRQFVAAFFCVVLATSAWIFIGE